MTTRERTLQAIGRRLKSWRQDRKLSQYALAKGICTQASLSNYENGKRDMPVTTAVGLAKRLGVGLEELLNSRAADPA